MPEWDVVAWLSTLAGSPWLLVALFLLVVGDSFLVVLPSETLVVALAALAGATGQPDMLAVIPVAAAGAVLGDLLVFLIGRRVGYDRWRWQREGRVGAAVARARRLVLLRPAVLVFTARYIPFARIAVNLSAGASGLPLLRFVPLSAAAGTGWALYNSAIGLLFGRAMREQPLLGIALSVAVAIILGIAVDLVSQRLATSRARRASADPHSVPTDV